MDSDEVKGMLGVESTHVEWKESYRNREEIYRAVADLARLEERRPEHLIAFDRRVLPSASLEDLDLAALRARWNAAREDNLDRDTYPEFEAWLSLEDVVRRAPGGWRPTVTGILLHGLDPQSWFPGAMIDFVRYAGTDYESPPVLRKRATGTLGRQLDTTWDQLQALNGAVPSPPDGIRQGFTEMFPPEVLKELARNLVQHRRYDATNAPGRISWFDDRIEFNNPGGPFGAASEGQFGEHSDYRNPTLTQGLVELGYVQRLGRGVRVARGVLSRAGHPDLRVETDGYTIVTVFRRP